MNKLSEKEFVEREFPMSERNFKSIQQLAYSHTGITLSSHKKDMIYGRLSRRLRKLDLPDFDAYCELLAENNNQEKIEFVNSITTNLTSFFREEHHFSYLRNEVIPKLQSSNARTRKLRVWSAGCSTGEEPYSIAMVFASVSSLSNWDVKILATDLDSNVVGKAKEGVYAVERAESVPQEYRKYLLFDKAHKRVKVKDRAKNLITFKQLNLLHEWPMKGPFDIIFCRNVVIYFDTPTQKVLFSRYADIMREGGDLIIGHSESLHNITNLFRLKGRTIYERVS